MKKLLHLTFTANLIGSALLLNAQIKVNGHITDLHGNPLTGAHVLVKGTYEGTSADSSGRYSLDTPAGSSAIKVTYMGYLAQEALLQKESGVEQINFALHEAPRQLPDVVISAGTFETADRKRSVTLQPLDIVTTPNAAGNLYGALATLPGTAVVGEDGRLFVRGGDGYETKTFIDGLLAKKPYSSSVPDLPSRGRFSPFLFSGTTFSTGGYSAEYGQALSSALILQTNGMPQKSQTEISLMSVGTGINSTLRGKKGSLAAGMEYINLAPYQSITSQKHQYTKHPETLSATLVARRQTGTKGLLKLFGTFSASAYGLQYPDFSSGGLMAHVALKNKNSYTNLNYTHENRSGWITRYGLAITLDQNKLDLQKFKVDEVQKNIQAKVTLKKNISARSALLLGWEETWNSYSQNYTETAIGVAHRSRFSDLQTSVFAEGNYRPMPRFALRCGIRSEYNSLLNHMNIGTRISTAYQMSTATQVSVAYGNFYQTPEESLLRFTHQLQYEKADHYLVNLQWEKAARIFRIELYHKQYRKLVTYNPLMVIDGNSYANKGSGYSKGIDLFFRDRETFQTLEYWISYSYVDSKRKYRDYPVQATPPFAPAHSASIVAKKWIAPLSTQIGISTTFASGRPYHNPNSSRFMDGRTPSYLDVSLNCSHLAVLWGQSVILYASASNLPGRNHIYGYRYAQQPDAQGNYAAFPIQDNSKRFYFVGIFVTL